MQRHHRPDFGRRILTVLFQTYLILWLHLDVISGQYDYDNEGGQQGSGGGGGSAARRGLSTVQLTNGQNQWDSVNQVLLDKCLQLQRMAVKKRNFGLEIPDIIMNRVQGGTEGNPALKEMRMRMLANGKRK